MVRRTGQSSSVFSTRGTLRPRTVDLSAWGWVWLFLIGSLGMAFLLVNLGFPRILPGDLNIYLAQPLTWFSLALLAYMGWRFGLEERPSLSLRLAGMAILTGVFQVAVFVIAGLLFGFGYSPYGHSPLIVLGNLLYVVSMVTGTEMSRAYLVAVFSKGNHVLAVVTPALLFTCLGISLARYLSVLDAPTLFRFYGETFLPSFAENLLASFLVLLGGPVASMAYIAILRLFEWLSPVLPNMQWTVAAFLGTMAPAFSLIVIRNQILPALPEEARVQSREPTTSSAWVVVTGLAVALLWFNTGLFGVRPTLISGVSMTPALTAGDIAVTRDVPPTEIMVGDIIRFQHNETYILHRVVEVLNSDSGIYFVTRGDANNVEDPPILGEELQGKVIFVVPKIGWLAIGVRRLIGLFR